MHKDILVDDQLKELIHEIKSETNGKSYDMFTPLKDSISDQ